MGSIRGVVELDAGNVRDQHVNSNADLRASKMRHLHKAGTNFGLAVGATPVAKEVVVFVALTDGEVRNFNCLLVDTGTATDVDFDLKKNGTTILSGVVNITHGSTDRQVLQGTLSATSITAGDVLSIELTVTNDTGAQGPFAWVEVEEKLGT